MQDRKQNGIDERALDFACQVMFFVRTIKSEPGVWHVIGQLVDAAGSIGANRAEGSSGSTPKEFRRFNEIALRSAKETVFWLLVCQRTRLGDQRRNEVLLDEAQQITRILAAIVLTAKRNERRSQKA